MNNNFTKGRTEKLRPSLAHGDCPICHQKLPSGDFMHTADFQVLVRNYHIARLTAQEANLFKIMRGAAMTTEGLSERMNTSPETVYVFIMNIRRKILPLGIKLYCVGRTYHLQFNESMA